MRNPKLPPNPSYQTDPKVGQTWSSRVARRTAVVVEINKLGTEIKLQTVGSRRRPSVIHISTLRSHYTPNS